VEDRIVGYNGVSTKPAAMRLTQIGAISSARLAVSAGIQRSLPMLSASSSPAARSKEFVMKRFVWVTVLVISILGWRELFTQSTIPELLRSSPSGVEVNQQITCKSLQRFFKTSAYQRLLSPRLSALVDVVRRIRTLPLRQSFSLNELRVLAMREGRLGQ